MERRAKLKLTPIKKSNKVYQQIIKQIQDSIKLGSVAPGDKLPSERVLAEMLSVSRTSVKEAVTVLEASGIITIKPGVGMFLNDDSQKRLQYKFSQILNEHEPSFYDLIELRQAMEGDAAYYAASRITERQKEKLAAVYKKLEAAQRRKEVGIKEDYDFHYTIVESAENPVMLEVINLVADKMMTILEKSRAFSIQEDELNEQVLKEHENIYQAVIHQEPEVAREAMWQHHEGMKQRHRQLFEDGGGR